MKILGIIIEANPYHFGHQYLINYAKEHIQPDIIIGVVSGYFSMRGEISVLPKYEKTKVLLESGYDLIIDLPTYCYLNSSKKFAENSIDLLIRSGVTDILFGIENGTLDDLLNILRISSKKRFIKAFKTNLESGSSYKKNFTKTLTEFVGDQNLINLSVQPNITLALEYLRALIKKRTSLTVHCIKRIGSTDNECTLTEIPSGTALRKALNDNIDISSYINYDQKLLINQKKAYEQLFTLVKALKLKDNAFYDKFLNVEEGINNYILNNLNSSSFEELLDSLANKKYSKSRLRRVLLSMILQVPKRIKEKIPLRVIGFSKNGSKHLKYLKNKGLITNIKNTNSKILQLELKVSKLYALLTSNDAVINEYKLPRKE